MTKHYLNYLTSVMAHQWNDAALTDYNENHEYTFGELAIEMLRLHVLFEQLEIKPGYTRADPVRMLKLCRMIEPLSEDKRFLYDCIIMTFDEEAADLLQIWRVMCAKEAAGEVYDVENALPGEKWIDDSENMNELEEAFKFCDLLFGYCEKFDHTEWRAEIMHRKNRISAKMTEILARQSLHGRRCAVCGKALPWNVPFGLCESCFRNGRGRTFVGKRSAIRRGRSSKGEGRSRKEQY